MGTDSGGHLHCYGFEYVTFQFLGLVPQPIYFGNFAITDLTTRSFSYGEQESSYPVPNEKGTFALHTGSWRMQGSNGADVLSANLPHFGLSLRLRTLERPVLEGGNGVVNLGPIGSSYYYSWTDLAASGSIDDHGMQIRVVGASWMDHQWGALNLMQGSGWDWFSMQLSNGQQYMLYFVRNSAGKIVQTLGTQVKPGGTSVQLVAGEISEHTTGTWTSPATRISYGSGWRLSLPHGQLTVTPDVTNQELDLLSTQMVAYWEGDVSIKGTIGGQPIQGAGYTELNPPGSP
jgi:predicted secreted hydrolase